MSLYNPKMILIDVDGTLVDSVPDLAFCIGAMLQALDRPVVGEERVRDWVGNGVERLVKRALVGQLEGEPDSEIYATALPIFLDLYKDNVSRRSVLYPGVKQGLHYLQNAGYALGCVTNKASQFTLPLLQDLAIHDVFKLIVCGDTLAKKKPDPLPLLHAANFFSVEPSESLMLGDSVSDVRAARAAGFKIFCMSYGYNHGEDIRDYNPDAVLDTMADLHTLLPSTRP
ncbi:MAG: phosphoglycolate phosphatase [Thiohalomonadales bacterium]